MYETLRLYSPVTSHPRQAAAPGLHLTFLSDSSSPSSIPIDPSDLLTINIQALHTSPASWSDAAPPLTFHASRFLPTSPTVGSSSPDKSESLIKKPHPNTFMPWISEPRSCPGTKFAQVEFMSVLSQLLRQARVKPVGGDEGMVSLRKSLDDSSCAGVTLGLNPPEDVRVV
ncbi:MAG: hypothetical protein Q9160_009143 [Pyrenula sp. 1 TL-2023]